MQKSSGQQKYKIIISAGGTGGHIFPAVAVANTLKERLAEVDILFIGAKDKMEMKKVPAAGYPIEGLWISGLQRSLSLKNLSFPFKVISSLYNAGKIIRSFKPDAVAGFGGFASGPTLQVASKKGIPTLIQEQNSYPGITNKILAKKVDKICVAYEGMDRFFLKEKIIMTGNPVRKEVIQIEGKREDAAKYFGLDTDKKTLFIVGGSLGALAVNKGIAKSLYKLIDEGFQVLWQTGEYYYKDAVKAAKVYTDKGVKVTTFIEKMDYAYALADLIISRAGAIAISEIANVAKPTIFVPLPTAAEDHQSKNAMALVEKDAALMVDNKDVMEELAPTVIKLFNDKKKQEELKTNLKKLAISDAAEKITDEIIKLINYDE
jgi:UDP-N-acetylglucosamine--N-acetylmuramyl-(pentapeptide) pyrophosphoryl-undecaprenol N-acetylglucosamine transferase